MSQAYADASARAKGENIDTTSNWEGSNALKTTASSPEVAAGVRCFVHRFGENVKRVRIVFLDMVVQCADVNRKSGFLPPIFYNERASDATAALRLVWRRPTRFLRIKSTHDNLCDPCAVDPF